MHTEKLDTIGDRCRHARQRRGLTQKQLADAAGVATGVIGNLEIGRSKSARDLVPIALVLQVTPQWLATGVETPPDDPMTTMELDEKEVALVLDWRCADHATRSLIEAACVVARQASVPKLKRA